MTKKSINLSLHTEKTLHVFGEMIQVARCERKMSQQSLAERIGVSRQTISAIEQGDAKVSIGAVFEAAQVVGIPLLSESKQGLQQLSTVVAGLASLLPERTHTQKVELDDDF